jgi:hypothetical protein
MTYRVETSAQVDSDADAILSGSVRNTPPMLRLPGFVVSEKR